MKYTPEQYIKNMIIDDKRNMSLEKFLNEKDFNWDKGRIFWLPSEKTTESQESYLDYLDEKYKGYVTNNSEDYNSAMNLENFGNILYDEDNKYILEINSEEDIDFISHNFSSGTYLPAIYAYDNYASYFVKKSDGGYYCDLIKIYNNPINNLCFKDDKFRLKGEHKELGEIFLSNFEIKDVLIERIDFFSKDKNITNLNLVSYFDIKEAFKTNITNKIR